MRRLSILLVLAGCSQSAVVTLGADAEGGVHELRIVGASAVAMSAGDVAPIAVRYVNADGEPIPGVVTFRIEGDAGGALLEADARDTDAEGVATTDITAGASAAFEIVASAEGAESVRWNVDVSGMRVPGDPSDPTDPTDPTEPADPVEEPTTASLDVRPTYAGARIIDVVEVVVLDDQRCGAIDTALRPLARAPIAVGTVHRFESMPIDGALAVAAFGINTSGRVAAFRCVELVMSGDVEAVVSLEDVIEVRDGTFAIEHVLDAGESFSPRLQAIIELVQGLAVDPAGYLVELAFGSLPTWARDVLGLQPLSNAVRAILGEALEGPLMDEAISADLAADVEHAFANLSLGGTLDITGGQHASTFAPAELSAPFPDGRRVSLPLDGRVDVAVSIGDGEIQLAEHDVAVPLSQVVDLVLREALLTRLPGQRGSIGDFVASVARCDRIVVGTGIGALLRRAVRTACEMGAEAVGRSFEERMSAAAGYDVLRVASNGAIVDSDGDYAFDAIAAAASAQWVGESGALELEGLSEGTRTSSVERAAQRLYEALVVF